MDMCSSPDSFLMFLCKFSLCFFITLFLSPGHSCSASCQCQVFFAVLPGWSQTSCSSDSPAIASWVGRTPGVCHYAWQACVFQSLYTLSYTICTYFFLASFIQYYFEIHLCCSMHQLISFYCWVGIPLHGYITICFSLLDICFPKWLPEVKLLLITWEHSVQIISMSVSIDLE